jgi:hypothetical protein
MVVQRTTVQNRNALPVGDSLSARVALQSTTRAILLFKNKQIFVSKKVKQKATFGFQIAILLETVRFGFQNIFFTLKVRF